MTTTTLRADDIRGKRLLALDYGDARIGVAVCDELHIVVSTRPVITNDDRMMATLLQRLIDDRIDVILVGVPRHHDDRTTPIIERIEAFIVAVRARCQQPVFDVDEAFSTQRARELMVANGMKKHRRQQKGTKDAVAAAVILRDVLQELGS